MDRNPGRSPQQESTARAADLRDRQRLLGDSTAFGGLGEELLLLLAECMRPGVYPGGTRILTQGAIADRLVFIVSGRCSAWLNGASERTHLADLAPGEVVGEMAALGDKRRFADVQADTEVSTLEFSIADFHAAASLHPELGMVLTEVLASRLGTCGVKSCVDGLGGKEFGGYRIAECVGHGGMSVVYRATRLATGEEVALKMMSHRLAYEPGAVQRFERESDLLLTLDHPGVCRVLERFSAFRTSFIAMEFCSGPDLATLVKRGPQPEGVIRGLIGQIAEAICYLHGEDVLHRDIKPSNVLLAKGGRLKLSDFGLARPPRGFDQNVSTVGRILGTPLYMAPEVLRGGQASRASDLYGLGCVALELATGRKAFEPGDLFDLLELKRGHLLPGREELGVSPELYAVITTCMSYAPEDRGQDLEAVAAWAAPFPARE